MVDEILDELRVLKGAVLTDGAGSVKEHAGSVDGETLAAVAAVAATQVAAIGEALAAGQVQRWYLVTEERSTFVSTGPSGVLCAVGPPSKNPEPTSRALLRWSR